MISRDELLKISFELDQALSSHQQWYKSLTRNLICRLPYNKRDVEPTAHTECRLGEWYYNNKMAALHDQPEFIALGNAHQHMHQLAAQLLLNNLDIVQSISPTAYDQFSDSLERLELEVQGLKNEVDVILSNHDPLTMTCNRVSVLCFLREQQELNKRRIQSVCIAIIAIDFLKKINEEQGHFAGDKILSAVAHFIMGNLRPYDKVFRYGDNAFLVCIPNANILKANELIDRIRAGIDIKFFDVGLPKPLKITVSCGVVLLDPDVPVEQSIDNANNAMRLAKSGGRNRTIS